MTTKEQLVAQLKAENPKMVANINGEDIELTPEEYEKAANNWADMRLVQIAQEAATAQAEADRAALLARLGITAEEAALLLGGTN
jgi:sulfur carrier protein ThiS